LAVKYIQQLALQHFVLDLYKQHFVQFPFIQTNRVERGAIWDGDSSKCKKATARSGVHKTEKSVSAGGVYPKNVLCMLSSVYWEEIDRDQGGMVGGDNVGT